MKRLSWKPTKKHMWDKLATWCIGLSFILLSFAAFALIDFGLWNYYNMPLSIDTTLALFSIAGLQVIALSDLYFGRWNK